MLLERSMLALLRWQLRLAPVHSSLLFTKNRSYLLPWAFRSNTCHFLADQESLNYFETVSLVF